MSGPGPFMNNIGLCLLFYQIFKNVPSCLSLNTYDMERPGKNLCVNESQNCSNQVISSSSTSVSCYMKYLMANSTECMTSEFNGEVDMTGKFGVVSLKPFPWYYDGIRQPNLNITFSNINWKSLKMRFVKVGFSTTQFCREFEVSGDIDPSSVISFDCQWIGETEGYKYEFEYVLTLNDDRKLRHSLLLQIPTEADVASDVVENYHVFIMMDQTEYPILRAKVYVPPLILNITYIVVTLNYKESVDSNLRPLKSITLDLTGKEEGEFITDSIYDTKGIPGIYYFTATCQSDNSKKNCIESSTPPLEIKESDYQVKLSVFLLAVAATGILIFYILKRKEDKELEGNPNVLFIYESKYPSHIENIYKFKEFLDCNCIINTKLDLIDIPKTESKNPWKWYSKAFQEADYVIIFASPKESSEIGIHQDNVYHNLQTYSLTRLVNFMLAKHKFEAGGVRLPGCSWKTLPPEVGGLIGKSCRFALPEELSSMLEFMNVSNIPNGASKFLTALQQSRRPPNITVTVPKQIPPDSFPPFYECDNDIQGLVLPDWVHLNLDGQTSSDEDEEERGFTLNTLKL